MDSSPLDEIRAALGQIEDVLTHRREAFEYAYGLAADDFDAPSVVAEVDHGRLTNLVLPDDLSSLPDDEAEAIINGVVIAAFRDWYQRYHELLNEA
jgi:hypothetical protein